MSPQRIGQLDVLNQRYLEKNVSGFIALVDLTVNYRYGEITTVTEQNHHWHREQLVDFAGDASQLGTGVAFGGKLNGEKEVSDSSPLDKRWVLVAEPKPHQPFGELLNGEHDGDEGYSE